MNMTKKYSRMKTDKTNRATLMQFYGVCVCYDRQSDWAQLACGLFGRKIGGREISYKGATVQNRQGRWMGC